MSRHHLVRVGVLGHVGRFTSVDAVSYARDARVVCRTSRGLEMGQVLAPCEGPPPRGLSDGSLLRRVTVEDDLLLARIDKNKREAYEACAARLAVLGMGAVLMEVEQLFDGQSLYFYFLGDVTPEMEALTDELAEIYEAKVQFRRFTETVLNGCGPDCGTDAAPGCGDACSTCGLSGGCGVKA